MVTQGFCSTYYYELDEKRYREKLQKLGGLTDLYVEIKEISIIVDWQLCPEVEYNFLIAMLSLYTGDSLKAYKSLSTIPCCFTAIQDFTGAAESFCECLT